MTTRSKIRLVGVSTFAVSVLFLSSGCKRSGDNGAPAARSTMAEVQRTKILRVGYVVFPPAVIKDPNSGEVSGLFVDAVRTLAERMNVMVRFQEAEWATFAAGLQNGQFDLSIAPTYRTIPRAQAVAFTRPVIFLGNGVIARRQDSRFSDPSDLNDSSVTIAVAQGSAVQAYAQANYPRARLNVLATSNLSLALAEVAAGRADAALADHMTTAAFASRNSNVQDLFANRPFELTGVGWAVRRDDLEWLQFVNTALDYLLSTGRLEQQAQKYSAPWIWPIDEYKIPE